MYACLRMALLSLFEQPQCEKLKLGLIRRYFDLV